MLNCFTNWFLRGLSAALLCAALAMIPAGRPGAVETPPSGGGAASDWAQTEQGAVRLVAATDAVDSAGRARIGLEFRLAPGWKVYWRSPGDAGLPPEVDWSDSENLAMAEMHWPLPERYSLFGLTTFVYGERVILPIDVVAETPDAPLRLRGSVDYLVCEKVCIPQQGDLRLLLAAAGNGVGATEHAAAIAAFSARVPDTPDPGTKDTAPLAVEGARLVADGQGRFLELAVRSDSPLVSPDALIEGPPGLIFGIPSMERGRDPNTALLRLPVTGTARTTLPPELDLTVTLWDPGEGGTGSATEATTERAAQRAIEQKVVAASTGTVAAGPGLGWILLLAVAGGLILNLMPCVLPVLSIKMVSVIGLGGADRGKVRVSFLATAAGILFSFMVLAAGVIALKAAGTAVGWGIQFQEPIFLAFMATVLTLFAANMFGWFEVPLPGFARGLGAVGRSDGIGGAFFTGSFATLLATPCSAPFLGTAIGFALTRGPGEIGAVFVALGVGLSLPYLLVAVFPGIAARLPRPGRWMVWLRRFLGLALLATVVWLLSVMIAAGGPGMALSAGLLLFAVMVLFALHRALRPAPGPANLARSAALALALFIVALPAFWPQAWGPDLAGASVVDGDVGNQAIDWRGFDRVALFNHVAEGRVVLVDVTADWCITCQANKTLVLNRGRVREALQSDTVIPMQADWTRRDPAIGRYLQGFGRFGIPFNAVYGPAAPMGIPLAEILTERAVLDALDRAAGGK